MEDNLNETARQADESMEEKRAAWDFAIGMMQVNGVKPDEEYLELVEKEIRGEITLEEMELIILKQYDETGRYQRRKYIWLNH